MSEGGEPQTEGPELSPQRSPAAERARRHRDRRRNGLRIIGVEVFEHEIDQLEALCLLAPGDRSSISALKPALERVIEVVLSPAWKDLLETALTPYVKR
jgi:hypothetical protein